MKTAYTNVTLVLTPVQWQWLENMATKHKLSSISKAIRCCINCVALEEKSHSPISKQSIDSQYDEEKVSKQIELSKEQIAWIETKQQDSISASEVVQRVVQSCMELDEYTVFGIIRCKSSVAKCEGAQESMKNIGQKYGKKEDEVVVKENIDIVPKDIGCSNTKA